MEKLNMYTAGLTTGAIFVSINNNNSVWWTFWLIIITILNLYCGFQEGNKIEANEDNKRFGYCKNPKYPRPPRPGERIGHNPSPIGEKPGFPGGNGYQPKLKYHDNSELEIMRKPPSTDSEIK